MGFISHQPRLLRAPRAITAPLFSALGGDTRPRPGAAHGAPQLKHLRALVSMDSFPPLSLMGCIQNKTLFSSRLMRNFPKVLNGHTILE